MSARYSSIRKLAFGICLFVFGVLTVVAQSIRGAITGTVEDNHGAVIVGAEVTLTSPSQGTTVTARTNGAGIYRFDSLTVGSYVVSATAPGFAKTDVPANVTVGALVGRDFQLVPSESGTVEVSTTVPDIQLEDGVRSAVISAQELSELPISNQNSLNLMLIVPGVAASKTGGANDNGIGSINGARGRSNNFLIDGINNNDISVMGPQFTFYNNDALQEVSIQTSNFTAEYGRAGGGVISQVTKSGTNSIHGTLAEVYRSHVFNASTQTQRNNYNTGLIADPDNPPDLIPKFVENIPAFTIGGPVVIPHLYNGHDKTFFFGAGQWDRYFSGGSQATFTVPTASGYAALSALASACPNVATYLAQVGSVRGASGTTADGKPIVGVSAIPIEVQSNLASTTCNGSARTGQQVEVGPYLRSVAEESVDNNHLVKIDHVASQKQNMMFRWMYDSNSDNVGGTIGVNPQFDVPFSARWMSGAFNHTYAFTPHVLNEFRFGFSRNNYGWLNLSSLAQTTPYLTIGDVSSLSVSTSFPQGRVSNTWQYNDVVTWVKARHAFKFGAEILRQYAVQVAPYNSRGSMTYGANASNAIVTSPITSLANYIDNFGGTGGSATINFGSGRYRPNLFSLALFAQDTFKVSSNLTVTYGVRYENFGQPANIFKYPAYAGPDAALDNTARVNQDNNNFGPSLGFAYSPALGEKPGSFVLRGGYQITYDTFYNNLLSNMAANIPNTQGSQPIVSTSNAATPRGYAGLSNVLPSLVPVALNPYQGFSSQFKKSMANPLSHHFSLGIQQAIGAGFVLDLAYVGALGRQLFFSEYANPIMPDAAYSGYAVQSTAYGTQYKRFYANRGSITPRESGLTSSYNSLQLQIRRHHMRTVAGIFDFTTSYTWSKNLDSLTDTFASYSSGAYLSKSLELYPNAARYDHGPSDSDRRHISSTMIMWALPGVRNRFANLAAGGWSLAPVLYVYSGAPYTVFNGTDRDLDGVSSNDRPNIGNPYAAVNTRAVITAKTNCATGYYDPNLKPATAAISTACVDPGTRRWVQAPTYQPLSPTMARRNSVTGSRYLDLDLNVLKKFAITERWKMELRGEFFNVTNNQNFDVATAPATVSSTARTFQDYSLVSGGSRTFRIGGKVMF